MNNWMVIWKFSVHLHIYWIFSEIPDLQWGSILIIKIDSKFSWNLSVLDGWKSHSESQESLDRLLFIQCSLKLLPVTAGLTWANAHRQNANLIIALWIFSKAPRFQGYLGFLTGICNTENVSVVKGSVTFVLDWSSKKNSAQFVRLMGIKMSDILWCCMKNAEVNRYLPFLCRWLK